MSQEEVINILTKNNLLTTKQISSYLDISIKNVTANLRKLTKQNVVTFKMRKRQRSKPIRVYQLIPRYTKNILKNNI